MAESIEKLMERIQGLEAERKTLQEEKKALREQIKSNLIFRETDKTAGNGEVLFELRGGPDNLFPRRMTAATWAKLFAREGVADTVLSHPAVDAEAKKLA